MVRNTRRLPGRAMMAQARGGSRISTMLLSESRPNANRATLEIRSGRARESMPAARRCSCSAIRSSTARQTWLNPGLATERSESAWTMAGRENSMISIDAAPRRSITSRQALRVTPCLASNSSSPGLQRKVRTTSPRKRSRYERDEPIRIPGLQAHMMKPRDHGKEMARVRRHPQ